jgi:hypothetical protein
MLGGTRPALGLSPKCVEGVFPEVWALEIAAWHTKIVHMGDVPHVMKCVECPRYM